MRCPVCRGGLRVKMDVSSLPKKVQVLFERKISEVCEREEESDLESELDNLLQTADLDMNLLERQLSMVMEIILPQNETCTSNILQTGIWPVPHITNGDFMHFSMQRSFQRSQNRMLEQNKTNSNARVRFHIQHPIMQHSLRTQVYHIPELYQIIHSRNFVMPFVLDDDIGDPRVFGTLVFAGQGDTRNSPHSTQDAPNIEATLLLHRESVLSLCIMGVQDAISSGLGMLLHQYIADGQWM